MKISKVKQRSPEWFQLRKGKISGTRFGMIISSRKNRLIYDLLDETLSDYLFPDDFVTDDMQFGIDNEPVAVDLYSKQSGIAFEEVGAILSETCPIHMASPDGVNIERGIVLEIKCTQSRAIQAQRFSEGVESGHLPQIKNYFAVSDAVKEVHWVSYCPFAPERPLVLVVFKREDFEKDIPKWRKAVDMTEIDLKDMIEKFCF
jgi:putative phage-type endonuclease